MRPGRGTIVPRAPAETVDHATEPSPELANEAHRQTGCVFCKIEACAEVIQRPQFAVRQCPRCGVMWCDPKRFDGRFNADNEDAYLEVADSVKAENSRRLQFLRELAPPSTHREVVEIGCMHGDFVHQMRAAGYEGRGLDLSRTAVDAAERLHPGCVAYGTLDESVPDDSLDVVAAFNVIEHMDAPHEFLDDVRRVLRPGGVLILETPKQESLYHHLLFTRGKLLADRDGVEVGLHPGTHIFKFGQRSWNKILVDRGFEIAGARSKSTPLVELLAKNTKAPLAVRLGIVAVGAAARVTRLDNRIVLVARLGDA